MSIARERNDASADVFSFDESTVFGAEWNGPAPPDEASVREMWLDLTNADGWVGNDVSEICDNGTGPVGPYVAVVTDAQVYIEDAGYPDVLSWAVHYASLPFWLVRQGHTLKRLVLRLLGRGGDSDMSAELATLLGDAELSAGLLPILGMGREVPGGTLGVRKGRLHTTWTPDASRTYFDAVRARQAELAAGLGARHQDNPVWHLGRRVITVHPLGGAPMGRSSTEGVVDPMGRVFGHPGLYVADGSVMPGTVGPNPSLTIAALAERFAQGILEEPRETPIAATEVSA